MMDATACVAGKTFSLQKRFRTIGCEFDPGSGGGMWRVVVLFTTTVCAWVDALMLRLVMLT